MTISDTVSIHWHAAIGESAIERWRTRWTVQHKQTHIATARCALINRDNFQEKKPKQTHIQGSPFRCNCADNNIFACLQQIKNEKKKIIFDLLFVSRFIWTLNVRQLIGRRRSYSCLFIKSLPYNVNWNECPEKTLRTRDFKLDAHNSIEVSVVFTNNRAIEMLFVDLY